MTLDTVISIFLLLLFSPIVIILAPCLVLSLKSFNVFFTQLRPGKNGNIFMLIKFKTMNDSVDEEGKLLPDANRLTTFGKFLRSTSLDELPQLINVIKGDMSLVGPRPLLPKYLNLYSNHQARRHEVKPGITGWTQINGRNTLDWKERLEMDVWYVDNLSFLLDLKILWTTANKVLKREGVNAYGSVTGIPFRGNVE